MHPSGDLGVTSASCRGGSLTRPVRGYPAAVIRPLCESDYDAWYRLWEGYLRFYRARVPPATTTKTFERLVSRSDGMLGLVALGADEALVGFAHVIFHPSTWSDTCYCYLEDLFVAPAARGTTAGRALIEATYDEADRVGAAVTYWQTQQYNGAARSLYDQVAHASSFIVYRR